MTTLLFTDPVFARHETPRGHPECSDRILAVEAALSGPRFATLERRTAAPASAEAIAACHLQGFVDRLDASVPASGLVAVDGDTAMGPHTMEAARIASGSAVAAVDAVVAGEAHNAFVASRPPGHHAERARAMGFCFINHVAVAARHARKAHGVGRIAIVDFDVHHGNGTQDIFQDDAGVFYASTHQSPLFPGTGSASERGVDNILNVPLPAGTAGADYRSVFDAAVMPAVRAFQPELVILSAGFDAHADDPLGGMLLVEADFVWITEKMMEIAAATAGGRIVSLLEGGYDLPALGRSVADHVATLNA